MLAVGLNGIKCVREEERVGVCVLSIADGQARTNGPTLINDKCQRKVDISEVDKSRDN